MRGVMVSWCCDSSHNDHWSQPPQVATPSHESSVISGPGAYSGDGGRVEGVCLCGGVNRHKLNVSGDGVMRRLLWCIN